MKQSEAITILAEALLTVLPLERQAPIKRVLQETAAPSLHGEFVSIKQYCEIIGISRRTFYRQFKVGKLPVRVKRVGYNLKVVTKSIEKLIS